MDHKSIAYAENLYGPKLINELFSISDDLSWVTNQCSDMDIYKDLRDTVHKIIGIIKSINIKDNFELEPKPLEPCPFLWGC